ncbi:hypothetical protein ABZ914_47075, partial [Spirillospora sp. NPDC046719]
MGAPRALGRRRRPPEELDALLVGLVDRLAGRLRGAHRVCRTVTLRLRFGDYARASRSHTLPQATAETSVLLDAARRLLGGAAPLVAERGLTLIGVSLGSLHDDRIVQLALPFDAGEAAGAARGGGRGPVGGSPRHPPGVLG